MTTPPAAPGRSLPRALRPFAHRDYTVLVSALIASVFAHGMWAVAMVYQVRALGGGPAELSVVATATSLGLVALVLLGGIAADRLSCRRIVIAVEVLSLAVMATTALLALTGALQLWHLGVVGFLVGAGAAFFFPAYSALLPRMLPADDLLAANGVEGTMRPVLQTAAGPAAAGILVASLSPAHAILGIACCHLVAVVGLNFITRNPAYDTHGGAHDVAGAPAEAQPATSGAAPSTGAIPIVATSPNVYREAPADPADPDDAAPDGDGPPAMEDAPRAGASAEAGASAPAASPDEAPSPDEAASAGTAAGPDAPHHTAPHHTAPHHTGHRQSVLADLREGFAYAVETPWLLWTLIFAVISVLSFMGPIEVLLPFVVSDRLGGDAQMFGFVLASFGLGSALGSMLTASLPLPRRYLTVMVGVWAFGTIPLVVAGFVTSFWVLAGAIFVVGVTSAVGNVIWGTLLQRRVPARMLGRISSLDFFVSLALMPVSMAVAGPVGEVVPLSVIFAVAAFVSPVVGAIAWFAGRMHQDELTHPLRRT
ncbi:hypothetical protein GCM10022377_18270 [Zhihengliuella alba]|uniref:MFS transporter n=1 Tax=Zhihengliuella alba TaxID=547018 RepID=A0ABP7DI46_9MICC